MSQKVFLQNSETEKHSNRNSFDEIAPYSRREFIKERRRSRSGINDQRERALVRKTERLHQKHFIFMSLFFKIRDTLYPRKNIIKNIGIKPGDTVLDFGCGPGSYIIPLYQLIGLTGTLYALDRHDEAIQAVKRIAKKNNIANLQTIHTDCKTELKDNSVDIILLYDVWHGISQNQKNPILKELHRILKPSGILSCSDHHTQAEHLKSAITNKALFKLHDQNKKIINFKKGAC